MRWFVVALALATVLTSGVVFAAERAHAPTQGAPSADITLEAGFNELVYGGETATVEDALSSIDGLYSAVFHWDNTTQTWSVYRPGQPAFLSDLDTMEFGQVYWIAVSAQVQLTIADVGGLGGPIIAITGRDFAFDGVPETVDAGPVTFTFENAGAEFHEMILARLPEGMTLEEALALPQTMRAFSRSGSSLPCRASRVAA